VCVDGCDALLLSHVETFIVGLSVSLLAKGLLGNAGAQRPPGRGEAGIQCREDSQTFRGDLIPAHVVNAPQVGLTVKSTGWEPWSEWRLVGRLGLAEEIGHRPPLHLGPDQPLP
jgi:hypothetical protein